VALVWVALVWVALVWVALVWVALVWVALVWVALVWDIRGLIGLHARLPAIVVLMDADARPMVVRRRLAARPVRRGFLGPP
jgi:hypothetical protein